MKCNKVRTRLAGYMDDAITGPASAEERADIRVHLDGCEDCREQLERFRRLSVVLSRVPRNIPPAELAVRIRVAAAQLQPERNFSTRLQAMRDRAEILLDNVFRPLGVPATGGFVSAVLVFVLVLQLIVPGITLRAVPNDVPSNILRPAELLTLSDYPQTWASAEESDVALPLAHTLMVDVTVDQHGQMAGYEILSGDTNIDLRHQLDQMLLFSRFRPMMSFGRPTAGGHVVLSFNAIHVRG